MPKGVEVDRPEESASSAADSKKAKEKEKKGKKNSWAAGRNIMKYQWDIMKYHEISQNSVF